MNKQKINVRCCEVFLRKTKGKKKMIKNVTGANHFSLALKRKIDVDDILCNSRLSVYKKNLNNDSHTNLESASSSDNESVSIKDPSFEVKLKSNNQTPHVECIELHIQRTIATHKYCCLCSSTMNLTTIPEDARMQSYIQKNIYIPQGNRCCRIHIIKNRFCEEDLKLLKVHSNTTSVTALE